MSGLAWAAFIFAVLAHFADHYYTKRAVVDQPSRFGEANKVMAAVLRATKEPEWAMGVAKAAFIFAMWKWQVPLGFVWAFGALGLVAGWHNRRLILRARRAR